MEVNSERVLEVNSRHGEMSFLKSKLLTLLLQIESSMDRATAYLTTKLSTLTDSYDICVTTYALTLVDAPAKETAFIMMQNKAIVNGKYTLKIKAATDPDIAMVLTLASWS